VKCGLCEVKKTTAQMLHIDRVWSKKCFDIKLKRCQTRVVKDQHLVLF